jgi:lipopolysaccharide/colanic/teichoic acid biosynthesis glycosyltransferase
LIAFYWIIFSSILTFLIEKSLSIFVDSNVRRYRLAFIIGFLIGLVILILFQPLLFFKNNSENVNNIYVEWSVYLFSTFTGAFFGGLLATWSRGELWENNSPPSRELEKEVLDKHLQIIGNPGSNSLLKRLMDLSLSIFGIVITLPLWFIISLFIWLEYPGPILFIKNSVTRGGRNFYQLKFRTMVPYAEIDSGPIQSKEGDLRILGMGKFLRKTALDEIPQLINIIKGDMSFVGPRPQRTVLVRGYLEVLPEYAERHAVLPGLAGLAQVVGDYYLTPRQKLRFDRVYIHNMNFGFDFKIIFLAFMIAFYYRWRKGWNGRLPRRLIRMGN